MRTRPPDQEEQALIAEAKLILEWDLEDRFLACLNDMDDMIDQLRGLLPPEEPEGGEIVG